MKILSTFNVCNLRVQLEGKYFLVLAFENLELVKCIEHDIIFKGRESTK